MYDCLDCTFSGRPPYKYPCSGCYKSSKWVAKEKPMTNADHIRAMSDEELAWAIDHAIVPPGMSRREWLKQPYEGEA